MTRKKRKQQRKQKPTKPILNKKQCWELARLLTKHKLNYPQGKLYCPICMQFYENAYNGSIQFCVDCFYRDGCVREVEGTFICRICERS